MCDLKVLPKLPEPIRYSAPLDADLPVLIQSVKVHGFEGLVAKAERQTSDEKRSSGYAMCSTYHRHTSANWRLG